MRKSTTSARNCNAILNAHVSTERSNRWALKAKDTVARVMDTKMKIIDAVML